MMSRFRQLELLLTIAVALAVGVLGSLDLAGPAVVGGATLTTLGLLASGSVHHRVALQALTADVHALSRQLDEVRRAAERTP